MGLFSRRTVQRVVLSSRDFLKGSQLDEFLNRLNGGDAAQRLTCEWELFTLSALAKLGRIEYEPKVPGTSKVDALLHHEIGEALVEITTVSDAGLADDNPVELLADQLIRKITRRGLNPAHFSLRVEGNWKDLYLGGPKPSLRLPRPGDFKALIFNERFWQFLDKVAASPSKASFQGGTPGSDSGISIAFDSAQQGFFLNYLQYAVPLTPHNNPIYNRLQKKAAQLKKAEFKGTKGILLCDAGCNALSRQGRHGLELGAAEIISSFLRNNSSVAFVLTLLVASDGSHHFGPQHLKIVSNLCLSPNRVTAEQIAAFLNQSLAAQFPRPETTPINAYTTANEGNSFYGGSTVTGRSVKISARCLMGILAGRIEQPDFLSDHPQVAAQIGRLLSEGRMIEAVHLERCLERDDDWIELSFSERDAAISPYHPGGQAPETSTKEIEAPESD